MMYILHTNTPSQIIPKDFTGMVELTGYTAIDDVNLQTGSLIWFKGGLLHRDDNLPSIVSPRGEMRWHVDGIRHRINGPAIIRSDGSKEWLQNGKHHRIDGPAIEYAWGVKCWFLNGKRHREDGPSIEVSEHYKNAHMFRMWYYDDKEYSEQEYLELIQKSK